MESKLTSQDLDMLYYYWKEVRDLERYSEFERLKPILQEERPEVLKAWYDYKTSIKIMDAVIKSLP